MARASHPPRSLLFFRATTRPSEEYASVMAGLGGRSAVEGTKRFQATLALGTAGLLVWTLLSGMPDAVRIAICAAAIGSLLIVRSMGGPWLSYTAAMVAALVGLLAVRAPGLAFKSELAIWMSFLAVAAVMLYLVAQIRRQSQEMTVGLADTGKTGGKRVRERGLADYGIAVIAPISGAVMVFNLSSGMPVLLRSILMLTVLGVLLQGVIARRLWIAYAAATVAVLAVLTSATYSLPAAALAGQWIAFAAVVGVVLYLVGRLRDQDAEIRSVDDMRTRFIALTNHELRTPVAVLYSVLETLEEDLQTSLSPQQRSFLKAALDSSHELAERVELLTQMHHLQQHHEPDLKRAPFDEILRDVARHVGDGGRNISLQMILSDDAASIQLPQIDTSIVLRQVLTNAIKYSPSNSLVQIHARVSDGCLDCEINDQGPGIPAGQESAIFEAFYQPGDVMRREADGLGVGLSLARMASRRMGATVQVRNQPNGGASVTLHIPAPSGKTVPFPGSAQRALPA